MAIIEPGGDAEQFIKFGVACRSPIYKPLTDISAYSALYLARRQDDPNTHLRAIREMLATTGLPQQRQRKRATAHSRK